MSQNPDQIEIKFIAGDDEENLKDKECQSALWAITAELRGGGFNPSCSVFVQDDVATPMTHLGEILVYVVPAVSSAVSVLTVAWLQARTGRKIRIKVGEMEVEASTPDEIKDLLKIIEKYESGRENVG